MQNNGPVRLGDADRRLKRTAVNAVNLVEPRNGDGEISGFSHLDPPDITLTVMNARAMRREDMAGVHLNGLRIIVHDDSDDKVESHHKADFVGLVAAGVVSGDGKRR